MLDALNPDSLSGLDTRTSEAQEDQDSQLQSKTKPINMPGMWWIICAHKKSQYLILKFQVEQVFMVKKTLRARSTSSRWCDEVHISRARTAPTCSRTWGPSPMSGTLVKTVIRMGYWWLLVIKCQLSFYGLREQVWLITKIIIVPM